MKNDEILLKKYQEEINRFEKVYIKQIYQHNRNYAEHRGYLIDLESYIDLQKKSTTEVSVQQQ